MNIYALYHLAGARFRRNRMRRFLETLKPGANQTILDVGGFPATWETAAIPSPITILNVYPIDPSAQGESVANVSLVTGDGCNLSYGDGSFDILFSNSVIEHVGDFERQKAFARECRRVGRALWVQTPAREFFMEPHLLTPFVHFLPVTLQRRLLRNFTVWGWLTRPDASQVDAFLNETRLLSREEMKSLFPDCQIYAEKFLGFTKSYVAFRLAS